MPTLSKEEMDYIRKALRAPIPFVPHVPLNNLAEAFVADTFRKRLLYGEIGKIRIAAGVIWGAGKEAAVEDWKQRTTKGDEDAAKV